MVKSRRRASCAKSRPNRTLAWRPSVSISSRSVVVSIGNPSTMTVTVPCFSPVGATLNPAARARFIVTSGGAVVPRSKSPSGRPSARSRTAPPPRGVSSPPPSSAFSARASLPSANRRLSLSRPPSIVGRSLIRYGRESDGHFRYALARRFPDRAGRRGRTGTCRAQRRTGRPASGSKRVRATNVRPLAGSGRAKQDRSQRRRRASGKAPPAREWPATSGIEPFVEVAQDARGRPPDIALLPRHCIKMPQPALPFPRVALMIGLVHQEAERRLEHILDFARVNRRGEGRIDDPDQRHDAVASAGQIGIEPAEWLHPAWVGGAL